MCYYNGVNIPYREFIKLKEFEKAIKDRDLFNKILVNGFDYGGYPVLKKKENESDFEIVEMEWGFLPSYINTREKATQFRFGYKKPDGKWQPPFTTLNAKGEELLIANKMFRDAALQRRCLVFSSGFYEWRHIFPLSQRTGKPLKTAEKYPYHIRLKAKEYFFMAGIWQPWHDYETGEYIETFAIITTRANPIMEQIHNSRKRMPVILTDDLAYEWLLGDLSEERITEIANFQIDITQLDCRQIAKNFRESVDPTAETEYPELPALKWQ